MVQKLREILLTRYIGSILVALLCWQALIVLIENVVRILVWVINDQRAHTAFGSPHPSFPWDTLILSSVSIALYLLTAYLLAQWLYPADPPPSIRTDAADEPSPKLPDPS